MSCTSRAISGIPAVFDRCALDEIDRAPEEPLQRVLQIGKGGEVVDCRGLERDEEIGVAAVTVEVAAPGRGAEDFQPLDAVAPADLGKSLALFRNIRLHV